MSAITAAERLNNFLITGSRELHEVDREICDAISVFEICERGNASDILLASIVAVALDYDSLMTENILMKYWKKLKPLIDEKKQNDLYELMKMKFPNLRPSSE